MNSVDKEWQIRLYHWAMQDFLREADEGFPILKRIKNRHLMFHVLPALESLDTEKQKRLISALVKKAHFYVVWLIYGEDLTPEEKSIYRWYKETTKQLSHDESLLYQKVLDGKLNIRVKRKKLAEEIKKLLGPVLGDYYEPFEDDWKIWRYSTTVGNWTLNTELDVEGDYVQLRYRHQISPKGVSLVLPMGGISIFDWYGIRGLQWDLLMDEDIEDTAQVMAWLCSHFLEACEELLDGLEPEQ